MTGFKKQLKLLFFILLVLLSFQTVNSQALIKLRSTVSNGGSSKIFISKGHNYYFQQSIGQSSVIGLSQDNNFLLRQGFIQPLKDSINPIPFEILKAIVSPNPFSENLTVSFAEDISDILYLTLYDLNGKIVYFNKYEANQELNLNLHSLAPAVYLIKVNTSTKCFYAKMIRD